MKKISILILSFVFLSISAIAQHTVVLKSGESMKGEIVSINSGTLVFNFKGNAMTFKTSELSVIYFEESPKTTGGKTAGGGITPTDQQFSNTQGVTYKVPGRKMVKEPIVSNLTQEKGVVVVDITVDKYGNVVKAEGGAVGSTTTSSYLITKAKQAAESVKFDTSPTMPLETKGSITIVF